jgi:gliding motility-associated-like protein
MKACNYFFMQQILPRYFIAFCILLLSVTTVKAQVTILTPDTTICDGQSATLRARSGTGTPTSTALTTDDIWSSAINIGFPFTFYGNTYSQCWISSNGYISFDTRTPGTFSNYNPNTGGNIPGNTNYLNCVMANLTDLDPSLAGSGTIDYAYVGVAPNRAFVVTFCDIPMWNSSQACINIKASFQLVLFEGTNVIEMHLRNKVNCAATSWGSDAVQGLQNATGTIAHMVPGRGYPTTPWLASRSSHRFTPTSATDYTIDAITFNPIATAGNSNINWYYGTNIPVGTGNTVTVTPTTTTMYYARQIYCSDTTIDSVLVTLGGNPNVDSVQVHHPSYCGNNDGSLVLFGLQPGNNYRIDYNKNGVPQPQVLVGASSAGTLTLGNLTSGVYANIGVSTALCSPANRRGPYRLIDPPIPVDFTSLPKFGCEGIDSVVFTNITPPHGIITYKWSFGDGQTSTDSDPTHAYFNQAVYNVKLVADNGVCRDSINKNIDTRHPLVARFNVNYTDACLNQVLTFADSSTTTTQNNIAPQYFWDFGDGATATGTSAIHAYTTTGTYTVKYWVTDFVPCTDTAYRVITVNAPPTISFTSSAATLCEGQASLFTADFHGDIPKAYEWTVSDGTFLRDLNPISHAFDGPGNYSIRLVTHYEFCPDTNFTQTVTVNPFPGVNIGPDTSICPGAAPITLRNFADNGSYAGATYTWNTGSTNASIQVNDIGTYSTTVNYNGCTSTDSMTIFKDCYLDIPNSFTPNNDGLNDYFLPRQLLSKGVTSYKMSVFNRWGQLVFETTALSGRGWDGRFNDAVQPQGVYIYVIDVSYTDGRKEHYTNNVTLIR